MSEQERHHMAGVEENSIKFSSETKVAKIEAKSLEIAKAAAESIGDEQQGKNVINNAEVAQALAENDTEKISELREQLSEDSSEQEADDIEAQVSLIKSDGFGEKAVDEAATVISEHAIEMKKTDKLEDLKVNRNSRGTFLGDTLARARNILNRNRNN